MSAVEAGLPQIVPPERRGGDRQRGVNPRGFRVNYLPRPPDDAFAGRHPHSFLETFR
jgi:hypothetical protein